MGNETYDYLVSRVHARFGEDVACTHVNDAELLGGFYMELDGTVYDMTVNTRLDQAKHAFDAERTVEA